MRWLRLLWLVIVVLLAACGGESASDEAASLPTQRQLPTLTAAPTETAALPTRFIAPTMTLTPLPPTLVPTVVATETAVTIPTATAAPTLTRAAPDAGALDAPPPAAASSFDGGSLFAGDLITQGGPVNATALQAVDFVFPLAQEGGPRLLWTAVTGSPDAGWVVEFYDEDIDAILTYQVQPNGEIRRRARAAYGLMPGFPLERAQISVDSDRALAIAAEDDALPSGALLFELRSAGDDPAWVIAGDDLVALVPAAP